jgi:hypothetical protein
MPVTAANRRRKGGMPIWVIPAVPVGLFAGVLMLSQGNQDFQANSAQMGATAQNQIRMGIEQASAEAERARAEGRYQSGVCIRVQSVSQGQVYDTLSPGNWVCGMDGSTGQLDKNRAVVDVARTNDQAVIRQFAGW